MSGPFKIIPATIALFTVSICSICQVPDFARVPNMWEGDSLHIVSLIRNGIEIKRGKAICWFPKDSLSARRMQEIADTMNLGITGAEKFMRGSLPKRLPLNAAAYTFYFRTDSFVSHSSLAGFVSIPFWRIKEGKAPWLHEAVHEMLTVGEIAWFSKSITDEFFNKHMPLWLSEGLATYVSIKVSQQNRLQWFDVFSRSINPDVDSAFRVEMQNEKSQYILSYIGARGVMPELWSPERQKYAPAFYHGSSSFVEFIADEYGLAVLLDAISSFQKEHEVIEAKAGKTMAALKTEWLKKLLPQKPIWNGRSLIIVDPDLRISYDGNVAHMEAYIAASAKNPDLLFACSEMIVPGRDLQASEARLYTSANAGAQWDPVLLPSETSGGWDNAVAAGPDGMLYFLTSNLQNGLTVYYSADDGKSWKSTVIDKTKGWDRPHMIIDNTSGSYRGRLYIAGETGKGLAVISSSDGAATFSAPIIACASTAELNMSTTASPVVLSDGSLVVSCAPYPNYPARASWSDAEIGLVVSRDGGQTFSPFRKALTIHRALPKQYFAARVRGHVLLTGNFMQGPSFAASPSGSAFADRVYAAWQDIDSSGHSRLMLAWSADRGSTWNGPQVVDQSKPGKVVYQGAPMLAVNSEGVVGIAWLDDRNTPDHKGYDIYFTASIDGGVTFLPPARISSATSMPARQGQNTLPSFTIGKPSASGERNITMVSPFSTRSTGGDYATMTVDAAGNFHPLWSDNRDGMAWQLFTGVIRVMPEERLLALTNKKLSVPNDKPCILDDRIQILFGEPQWNNEGNEVRVPVRLLNISPVILTEPLTVQVSGAMLTSGRARTYATEASVPKFLDPVQGGYSDSARFTYPASLQTPLFSNGVTAELTWRIRITAPEWVDFSMKTVVSGGGCLLVK